MQRIYLLILIVITLTNCRKQQQDFNRISSLSSTAESAYLTHDQHKNPVIAWTEKDSTRIDFFYAISSDGGKSFNDKIQIAVEGQISTHPEGMPKIAFGKNGTVIAAYEKKSPTKENKYAGSVYYVQSNDNGKTWTRERFIHSDTVAGRSRSYFDITTLPDGEVAAVWLDIKMDNKAGGRSVRFSKTQKQNGFANEILIDSAACECCRIDVYADPAGIINIAYRGLMNGNMGQRIRDMMLVSSTDGGANFTKPIRISADNWMIDGCPHTGPSLCSNKQGLHALWYSEGSGQGVFYAHTEVNNNGFTAREQISSHGHHPQLGAYGEKTAMIWEENFGPSNKTSTRVHYQLRHNGKVNGNFLTSEDADAYLPVIIEGEDKFVIAFLMEDKNGTGVYYTTL